MPTTWWRSPHTWRRAIRRTRALPAARLGSERRDGGERTRQRLRTGIIEPHEWRARLAAVAANEAQPRLELRGAAGFHRLTQRRDLLLRGARLEQLSAAAGIEQIADQPGRDTGERREQS